MASTKLIGEEEASGRVKEVYADIRGTLGIDFVPNMYRSRWTRSRGMGEGDHGNAVSIPR